MKKSIYFIIILFILVSCMLIGCSHTPSNAEQEGRQLLEHIITGSIIRDIYSKYTNVYTGLKSVRNIQSKIDNNNIQLNIVLSGETKYRKNNKFTIFQFSGRIYDKLYEEYLAGFGTVNYIKNTDQEFIQREEGAIDIGAGNAEGILINTILDTIHGKRILIDNNQLLNQDIFSFSLLHIFYPLFQIYNTISYNAVHINNQSSKNFLTTDIYASNKKNTINKNVIQTGKILEGYITYDKKRGRTRYIKRLKIMDKGIYMTGNISTNEGILYYISGLHHHSTYRNQYKNTLYLVTEKLYSGSKVLSYALTIRVKTFSNKIRFSYKGEIHLHTGVKHLKEKLLVLPITGMYTIEYYNTDTILLQIPKNYLLLSQLFGDEYGILYLLQEKD